MKLQYLLTGHLQGLGQEGSRRRVLSLETLDLPFRFPGCLSTENVEGDCMNILRYVRIRNLSSAYHGDP